MEVEFRLPDLGEGVAEAEIVEWHVAVGQKLSADDPLVDVQTDKAIVSIPSPYTGKVVGLGAEEEEMVAVGAVLVTVETADAAVGAAPEAATEAVSPTQPPPASASPSPAREGALASPAIRRLARERGIELESIAGSGPKGRIQESDLGTTPAADLPPGGPASARPSAAPLTGRTLPLRGSRRLVAEAMSEAWRTIPHITDLREVEVSNLLEARRLLKARLESRGEAEAAQALTVFALLATIVAGVVSRHPAVNATVDLEQRQITYHDRVDLNVAVSTPQGLLAPVVRAADTLSMSGIARELQRLGTAARDGTLAASDLTRGTVTASNYGSLGSPSGTTIIQPGQTAIVGFGRAVEKPVVGGGAIVVGSVMQVHCSGDHRAMDGLELQAFTAELAATVENPALLLAERD